MQGLLDKQLLFLFCMPLFFLLHGINENFGLIPFNVILRLSLFYISITIIVIFLSVVILRTAAKAAVFSLYLLSIFFLFGAFHDFLKSIALPPVLSSYSVLLPLMIVITFVLVFYLKKQRKSNTSTIRYFYYLMIVFVFMEITALIYNETTNVGFHNELSKKVNFTNLGNQIRKERPDIFFIVLDGYTSSKCLSEEFNYQNSEIDSLLSKNKFYSSSSSESNYNVTPFSLSSTMNLDYLKSGLEKQIVSSKVFLQAIETFKENQLVKFLKSQGYDIKNFGCFDLSNALCKTDPYFIDLYFHQINQQTLTARIMRDIGWNFAIKNIFTGTFKVPDSYRKSKAYHIYRNNYNWAGLMNELSVSSNTPRFVYVHLMLPHEPFFLDSNGNSYSDTSILLNKIDLKEGYLGQLKYANTLLKDMIPKVSKDLGRDKVVIIEGDHGYRDFDEKVPKSKVFMNLNAYYFSDGDYTLLYDSISPVNTFRVVLSKYFSQSLPAIKDSSVYLINDIDIQ